MLNLNKLHIQRQFDRSAQTYDCVAGMQREIAADLMTHLSHLTDSSAQTILDAGCGTGYGLQFLKKRYPSAKLTGLDLAPAMLQVAQQQLCDIEFVQGDIECLPFESDSFDIAWSSSAVQWCELSQAVHELSRVTKPGGRLLVSTFAEGTLAQWRQLWGIDDDVRFLSERVIRAAFESAGLEQGLLGLDRYREIRTKCDQIIQQDGVLSLPYHVVFVCAVKTER